MGNPQAVLFDFDGVIADSEPVHFECWREILAPFDIDLDWATYAERGIGVSDRSLLSALCQVKDPPLDVELLVAQYPRKKDLFRGKMSREPRISQDFVALLDDLDGYSLAVVTSSGRSEVEPILESAGILQRFGTVVYGGDVERLKPAPDPYLLAAKRLEVSSALVVEDSEAGSASGLAAGFEVLRVTQQSEVVERVRRRLNLGRRPGDRRRNPARDTRRIGPVPHQFR